MRAGMSEPREAEGAPALEGAPAGLGPRDPSSAPLPRSRTRRKTRLNMQMIFQDPNASLNPRMTLLDLIGEPLVINKVLKGAALTDRVAELLEQVGLSTRYMRRYPHALSGGQRQRW